MRPLILLVMILIFGIWVHAEPIQPDTKSLGTAKSEPAKPKVIKKVRYKKTQELSFDSESVDGVARNPYGAYLTQKRGIEFTPLYKVRDRFDENIKDSVHYMKVAK